MNRAVLLDRAAIAARIPHAGSMCLLDGMLGCSRDEIVCIARNQADPSHPLRSAGGLLAPAAAEYASQAMALHGALHATPGARPRAGYLAALRGLVMHATRLDDAPGALTVRAVHLAGDARQALYRFELRDGDERLLVEGRATVVLDAA
jgi:predicted hotdog family 3-hydroxylacyl-ACP dehydratase